MKTDYCFSTIRRARVGLCAAGLLAAGFIAPVSAQAATTDTVTLRVPYRDLNVSDPDGARALYFRLQRAAQQICGNETKTDLADAAARRACYRQALEQAVMRSNLPALLAVHLAHTGGARHGNG